MIETPCFLVGAERSGTTMTRLMLSAHPAIAWSSEFEYAVDLVPDQGGWPDLTAYYDYLAGVRSFVLHGHAIDRSLDYPALVDSFLVQTAARKGTPAVVGATVHRHFDRLLRIWPDARFIHMLRDPRDVGRSVIAKGWAGNMWTAVVRWIEAEQLWAALRGRLEPDRVHEMRYEELVRNPEGELDRLCRFLGVAYDPAMLDYANHERGFERPNPSRIGQWRGKLRPDEVRLAEARLGSMLTERGYEPSGLPPLEITPALRRRLERQDYWYRVRHRWSTIGPRLFVEDYVSRRVGIKAWRDNVRDRLLAHSRQRVRKK
ncbi:MAG: sulfotransferase [Chloroflexi bacterium]|jgi:hypothetical protein|nr:sulfotransferase [Chloroflexota bacterium]